MATIELEKGTGEEVGSEHNEDDDDKLCHLYLNMKVSLCGLPTAQDQHACTHPPVRWEKGMMACPVCGTPICLDCILICS